MKEEHKHKYHFFSKITNPDKKIEAKVKYFFDCLLIAFRFTNKHYDFPCENHKTVVTSIYYQIKFNKPKYAKKHISFYLELLGKELNQYIIFDYNTDCLSKLKDYINLINEDEKNKKNSIQVNFTEYILPIEKLINQLEETYFSKCLQKIINHVASDEELESNQNNHSILDCIFKHTKLIAVDFYLTGASQKDINNIIRNICNDSNGNYEDTRHLKSVFKDLDKYFKNRKLSEQLKEIGLIYNHFKSNQVAIFFIHPRYTLNNNIDIDFYGVKITSTLPNNIDKNWFDKYFNGNKYRNSIISNNTIYATVEMNNNHSNTVNLARDRVQLAINSLSIYTENQYTIDFAYYLSNNFSSIPITKHIDYENDSFVNTIYANFKINKKITNREFDKFLTENDFIFKTGIYAKKRSEILTNLWFYLEAYYKNSEDVIKKTSFKLSQRLKDEFEYSLYSFIEHNYFIFLNGMPAYVKEEDRHKYDTNIYAEMEGKLKFFKKRFKHPILTKKLIAKDNCKCSEFSNYQKFIRDYLKQVYINRNLFVHSLKENEYFLGRNLNLLLSLSNYFRQDLINKAIETK